MAKIDNDLDELQSIVEKILALLKDRQIGLISWYFMFNEDLQELKKLLINEFIKL